MREPSLSCNNFSRTSSLMAFTNSRMRSEGNGVDTFNLEFAIKASGRLLLLQNGRLLHCLAIKSGLEADLFIVPALLGLYADSSSLNDAHKLFERFSYRSSVMWSLMIKWYLKFSQKSKIFELFSSMTNHYGLQRNAFTMEGLVRAYANVLACREGKAAHGLCIKNNLLVNVCLQTSVVYMYMKCGFLRYAVRVFEEANDKDEVLWTAVIDGYAQNGRFLEGVSLFRKMLGSSVTPNPVTLACVLLACSGVGSLNQGKSVHCFVIRNKVDMDVDYAISPAEEHYACMIDLLVYVGQIEAALSLMCNMPIKPGVIAWRALLSACRINKRVEIAEELEKRLSILELNNPSSQVSLSDSNIYADATMLETLQSISMKKIGGVLHKTRDFTSIEEARVYAKENGLFFMETSAKSAANVNLIFYEIDYNHLQCSGYHEMAVLCSTRESFQIEDGFQKVSGSPCGACKFLRRKCAPDCLFAPYFCSDQGAARFAAIHKVFGASNVSKMLLNIAPRDRCEAVLTISYEAQARIRDPVYGCVSHIYSLQQQVAYLQAQVMQAKTQLAQKNLMLMEQEQQQQWGGVGVGANNYMVGGGGAADADANANNNNNMMMMNPMCTPPQSSLDSVEQSMNINEGVVQFQDEQLVAFPKRRSFNNNDLSELQQLALTMMRN
ncbi:pentatricopeptide repeat-containing protein [Senna tora]|uniref:Pentatricopeptide repeat-containing protein n=1 Tax=Senna tora TaxID=362788 RepID=A0A835CG79_9FABA|nr:pentatricopeptide repeat-containing protein [Senna tora]